MLVDPHFIKFENPKRELYLTFSAVVDENHCERILGIQKDIRNILREENLIELINPKESLHTQIERGERLIYEYPKDRLHFSIVNFATYKIKSFNRFDEAKDNISDTINFKRLGEEICNFKRLFNEKISKNEFRVEIRRIYLPAGVENSLTLNAFPSRDGFFENLKCIVELAENKMNQKQISHEIEIKAYPKDDFQYFALNIFRFIDSSNIPEKKRFFEQGRDFYEKIEKINEKIKDSEFIVKMEPRIVISDPYLANKDPYKINCQQRTENCLTFL